MITTHDKTAILGKAEIDILEEDIYRCSHHLLNILLKDRTTDKNILWACDEYASYGPEYRAEKEILFHQITGKNTKVIQPRIAKSKEAQKNRTKKSAEVFTPSWICNEMNNYCDEQWFGKKDVFNIGSNKTWQPTLEPIQFRPNKNKKRTEWMKYVDATKLEITCGEAPFLVSRYDTTTGVYLPLKMRIGILDRKLRVVNENTKTAAEWFEWTKRAFEATYGYEYQGDNLLLARENLFLTFIDYYHARFGCQPKLEDQKTIATIISWNIWQMDGLKDTVPYTFMEDNEKQYEFFRGLPTTKTPVLCKIKDWRSEKIFTFHSIKENAK